MLTFITPCSRQDNLPAIVNSINFDKIHKWIIVYDTSEEKRYNKLYENHTQIMEVECNIKPISGKGQPQRNYGMSLVDDGYIYFLDDDNIIHPQFWSIVDLLDNEKFFTFDQIRKDINGGILFDQIRKDIKEGILYGNKIIVRLIDTAMFIVHKKHIGNIKWLEDRFCSDGFFICDIYNNNKESHVYINSIGCYYNYLQWV